MSRSPAQSRQPVQHRRLTARLLSGASVSALLLLGLPTAAEAQQTRYWDANATAVGTGGTGTWNLTAPTWSPSADGVSGPYAPWNNAALDNVIFGGTAGTVTLGAPITVHDLTFNTAGYTLTGSTLTLAGTTPTIATNSGNTAIDSVIAGSAGLTKAGGGGLILNGNNTFTGGINLNVGSLYAANDAALGAASNNIFTAAAANVRLSIGGAGTARTVTIGDGGNLILEGTGSGSARIRGNGSVQLAASGITMSNDLSDYTGRTVFTACNGTCSTRFTSIGNLGEASSLGAPVTVADGTIIFNQQSQYSDSIIYLGDGDSSNRNWDINGNAALIRNQGTGTLEITGDVDISASGTFYADTADVRLLGVLSGGAFGFNAAAGRHVLLGNANIFTGTANLAGEIRVGKLADIGNASSLGAGTTIGLLNGTLSYIGAGDASDREWLVNGTTNAIRNDGTGALNLSGALVFNAANPNPDTLTFGGSFAGTNIFSGVVSGNGNIVADSAGTWVLGGANIQRGTVTVNNGTLRAGAAGAFGATTGLIVNGGTLDLGGFDLVAPSLTGTGGTVALGSANLTVNTATGTDDIFSGIITGAGGLTKTGRGILTLRGANGYTGATTVNGGTLVLEFNNFSSPVANIIASASTLNMAGGALTVFGDAGEDNVQTFNGLNILAGNNRIGAQATPTGSVTINFGAINRSGGLVDFALPTAGNFTTSNTSLGGWATVNGTDYAKVVGGNIVAFTDADYTDQDDASLWADGQYISDSDGDFESYFGTVASDVQLAGLQFTTFDPTTTVTIAPTATLGIDGTIIVATSVGGNNQTITGGSLTGGSGGSTLGVQQNSAGTFIIGSTIVDNGGATSFAKAGSGVVRLTGANSYTGGTTLSGGRLEVTSLANGGVNSSIGASSADAANLVLESGTLAYIGGVDAVSNRGMTLVNGGAERAIEVGASRTVEFSGLVTSPDDAGLTKTGAGTLTLANAANDYVGATTVSGGTLAVNTLTDGGVASGIGAASNASANLVLTTGGQLRYTGGTTATDRGFTLASGTGRIDVEQAAATLTISGVAAGTGGFVKDGAGTLILSGANIYAGDTTVTAGVLRAGSAQAFGPGGRFMTVNSGATLDLGGFDIGVAAVIGGGLIDLGGRTLTTGGAGGLFTGRITGTGGYTRIGGFTQTFSGCSNDYTGVTTIGGALSIDCIANGGQASSIGASSAAASNLVFAGGTLIYTGASVSTDRGFAMTGNGNLNVFDAGTTLEFSGTITGAGQLNKDGAGTLLLSGTNNATGNFRVINGTVRAASTSALGNGWVSLDNTAGVLLDLDGYDNNVLYLLGGGTAGGNITLDAATLTINQGGGAGVNFGGAISGSGGLIKNGNGFQQLSGCASSYGGTTVINGGVLAVSCLTDGGIASSIGTSGAGASNLILNGGTLRYVGAGDNTNRQFTLGASAGNALDASGTGAINFTSGAAVTFAAANTAQTLTLTGTNTSNNILAAQITNNGTGVTRLTKTGAGTWILTNPGSTYTGITTISGGVLGVDKLADGGLASSLGASSAAAANLVIGNGSTLRYTGAGDTTNRLFTLSAGTTFIESSGTGAIVFTDTGPVTLAGNNQARTIALGGTNTGNNTLAGSIGNAGTGVTILAKNDSGTWVLTGNNTYTGNTVINAGTLVLGNGGTTGAIAGNIINAGTLGFDRSDSYVYAGAISGTGAVVQRGTGTTILTGTNIYTGGTTISAGTLQLGNGGATGRILGDVANDSVLAFNRSDLVTFGGVISGSGTVRQIGSGTTVLTGTNTYTGGTVINGGRIQISRDANLGAASGSVSINNAFLETTADIVSSRNVVVSGVGSVITNAGTTLRLDGVVSGTGAFRKALAGTLILTGDNSYTGNTIIAGGTLQLGDGGTSGSIIGDVLNDGSLVFNRSDDIVFAGLITGTGSLTQNGSGIVNLTADNRYEGATTVNAGTLLINGDQSAATGLTTVNSGATLGGSGRIGGDVFVADGGILAPGNSPGTLTIAGDLALSGGSILNYEFGEANVVGGALNDLVNVGGDLVLDGTINVSVPAGGNFGGGLYRVFNYGGTLTDNGLALGALPPGSDVTVQTSVAGQVNLINSAGLSLSFWDGDAGPKFNDLIDGGNGIWQLGGTGNNWTDATGGINAAYADATFAIFAGTGGTVTIDNSGGAVTASGMQFASNGYVINGAPLTLVGPDSVVRVGDGTALGAGFTATIAADLTGASQLVKTDAGTLVLTGANSYTGGTLISGGVLSVADDSFLGDVAGALTLDGGTLRMTGTNAPSVRTYNLGANGGAIDITNAATANGVLNGMSGVGGLTKLGAGSLALSGANTYTGGTTVQAGTLIIGGFGGLTTGSIVGDVVNNATLTFDRSNAYTYAGSITGTGNVIVASTGVTTLTGNSNYAGGTRLNGVNGQLRIAGGANVISGGSTTLARSTLSIDGANSLFSTTLIGGTVTGSGATVVRVTDGGTLRTTTGGIDIRALSSVSVLLDIDGANSLVDLAGGVLGATSFNAPFSTTISAGGTLRTGGASQIGTATSNTNPIAVAITGAGSNWTSSGSLLMTAGDFTVDQGGAASFASATFGTAPQAANLSVSGASSSFATTGDLVIGTGTGTGALTLTDDAQATVGGSLTIAQDAGSIGTVTIGDGGVLRVGGGTLAMGPGNAALNIGSSQPAPDTVRAGTLDATDITFAAATNLVNFNHVDTDYVFATRMSGAGSIFSNGTGTTILTAANAYSGGTSINSGTFIINGDQSAATGVTSVNAGGTLGGMGIIGGDVLASGRIKPGDVGAAPGMLTINGQLLLSVASNLDYSFGQANVVGGAFNDLIEVGGNLTLDGTLNVTVSPGGNFDPGVYRVINYAGTLTDNGLAVDPAYFVQTSVANQVNLVNTTGLTMRFWDGAAGAKNDGVITGGGGLWQASGGNDNWTEYDGSANAPFTDAAFAVFSGLAGTVTVDDSLGAVTASGMQFASDGYVLDGDPIVLTGVQSVIRVGDGTTAGAGYTATIGSALAGASRLVKSDLGTLVLTGVNTYAGGTAVNGGTLQISADSNLGDVGGGLAFDGGTLHSTADIASGRAVDLVSTGTFLTDAGTTLTMNGAFSGAGNLVKTGTGTLVLRGTSGFAGNTTVDGGRLSITDGGSVSNFRGFIGNAAGQTGEVVVSGPGSNWTNANHIYVGFSGTGLLTIENGATVSNANGNIGVDAGSTGIVTVSGAGSTWTSSDNLRVGVRGEGSLTVDAGANVVNLFGSFSIGQDSGSRGSVVASGAGSTITARLMVVGNSGDGQLTIANGAEVSSDISRIGADAGSQAVINIGAAAGQGPAAAGILNTPMLTFGEGDGTLVFNHTDTGYLFSAGLDSQGAGTHAIQHLAGTTILNGDGSGFTGTTTVSGGTLLVGDQSGAGSLGGAVNVALGGTIGGAGTIGGDVAIADGGALAAGVNGTGTLTINGDLSLAGGSALNFEFGQANVAGGALNDLVNVGGDLVLDGTINVSVPAGGNFGAGIYRVFNYGGALTDNGLELGVLPAGSDVTVQTAIAGQVNLVNAAGLSLNFWDGAAGPKNNNAVDGGNGVWRVDGGNNNWTDLGGAVNADYAQDGFAVFAGAPGIVTIDDAGGAVRASGLQFAVDGYDLVGDALTLTGPQATIRVGDGTAAGAAYRTIIRAELTGAATLVKTDAGLLVLTGTNSYTGGTAINGGTIRVASDANLGATAGALSFNGGTLNTGASFSSGRALNLIGTGTLSIDAGTSLILTGATSGAGGLVKSGGGTLVLDGAGSHTGGTNVTAGTLLVNGDHAAATGPTSVAGSATLGGTGTIGGNVTLADGATLAPGAAAPGTLAINGDLSLSSGSRLAFEFGQANVAGGALNDLVNVGGDLVLDGTIDVAVPAGGSFDVGIYRVFNYGGTLTDNGLTLGGLPVVGNVTVQTSIAGQVNLVNAAGPALNFWDGAAGPGNNGVINGGDGIWQSGAGNDNWTEATGAVNGPYDDAAFAIFAGTGGTVTVDGSLGDVTTAGMQFAANGYTIAGDAITLVGPQSTLRVGDGSAAGAGFTARINAVLGGATQLVKTDAGTLVLGGANTYTGGTLISGGTVQIASDANLGAVAGNVTLDGGTLATSASLTSARDIVLAGAGTISTATGTTFTFDGLFAGTGALTKAGAGTLLVTGDNGGYAGAANVAAGTLAVQGTLGGAVTVGTGARLEGTGRIGSLTNNGVVAPGRDGFGTLTATGGYAGAGGTLEIETELGGDASQTDRLVVASGTSGATEVIITNRGGLGAQTIEGIKIIDVTGGASSGTFALRGDYSFEGSPAVIAGAFGYRLFQGGVATPTDGDWYLRSALLDGSGEPEGPLYQPGVPLYESYASTLQTLNGLPTLQERVGNRQWSGFTQGGIGMWGRIEGSRLRPEAAVSTSGADVDTDTWGLQIGFDAAVTEADAGVLIAGVNGRYGTADARVRSEFGNGTIDTSGYSLGATLTWYGNGGFYADAQAQLSWYDSDLDSDVLGSLLSDGSGSGEAFSLEIGQRLPVSGSLSITPQAQIVYSNVRFDAFVDPNDAAVSSADGDSLRGRLGLSLDHQRSWQQEGGDTARTHFYGFANLEYEMLNSHRADVSETPLLRRDSRLWGELGVGGSYSWNDGRFAIFSEISANTALANFGDSNGLRANAGFRMRF